MLSSAREWTSVILAGKQDSRRHSTTSFAENDVVTKTSYQMLEAKFYYFRSGEGLNYPDVSDVTPVYGVTPA